MLANAVVKVLRRYWESLPGVYRQCAVIYTDEWEAYRTVLPQKRHQVVHNGSNQRRQLALNSAPAAFNRPLHLNYGGTELKQRI